MLHPIAQGDPAGDVLINTLMPRGGSFSYTNQEKGWTQTWSIEVPEGQDPNCVKNSDSSCTWKVIGTNYYPTPTFHQPYECVQYVLDSPYVNMYLWDACDGNWSAKPNNPPAGTPRTITNVCDATSNRGSCCEYKDSYGRFCASACP